MATDVLGVIDDLEETLDHEQFSELPELVNELVDTFDEAEPSERSRVARAREIVRRSPEAPPPEVVAVLDRSGAVQLSRAGAALVLGTFAVNPVPDRAADLVEIVDGLRTHERAWAVALEEAAESLDGESLPPAVRVLSIDLPSTPIPLGTTFTVDSVIGNVGDEPADDVMIAVDPTDWDTDPQTESVGDVEGDARIDTSATFTAVETGDLTVAVEATTETGRTDSDTIAGEVLGLDGFLDRAGQRLGDVRTEIAEADLHRGLETSLTRQLDVASKLLAAAEEYATGGKHDRAKQAIVPASGVLRAVRNRVDERSRRGRSDADRARRDRDERREGRGEKDNASVRRERRNESDEEDRRRRSERRRNDDGPYVDRLPADLRASIVAGVEDVLSLLDSARAVDVDAV